MTKYTLFMSNCKLCDKTYQNARSIVEQFVTYPWLDEITVDELIKQIPTCLLCYFIVSIL